MKKSHNLEKVDHFYPNSWLIVKIKSSSYNFVFKTKITSWLLGVEKLKFYDICDLKIKTIMIEVMIFVKDFITKIPFFMK